jgi:large subunit ribosomal protein L4
MMKIAVKNFDNQQVREIDLPEEIFGYPYKSHLIHEAVQAYLAGLRSGTHKVKTRSEVSGSGRKLWRQKGTGRARVKDLRNPKWRGGGTVHGPVPHSHAKDLSRREKKNALKSALSRKLADQEIVVVESLEVGSPKTQELLQRLGKLGMQGKKALLIDSRDNQSLAFASRNVRALKAVDALAVNVYDVVDRSFLVVSEDALHRLVEVLAK